MSPLIAIDQFDSLSMAAFKKAFVFSLAFHCVVLLGLLTGRTEAPIEYSPLAVMEFGDYDPLGGQGGGQVPEPEPEPEPEPVAPEEDLSVVESVAPEAEEAPAPPPPPVEKPKNKPKPKPKAAPTTGTATGEATSVGEGPGGPGPGGTPGGTGRGTSNAEAAYQNQIRRRLERSKKYPSASQSRREQGVSVVTFLVQKDGSVTSPRLLKSSGFQRLDDEAMALLRRVSPLPPIPPEVGKQTLALSVPLRFSIR